MQSPRLSPIRSAAKWETVLAVIVVVVVDGVCTGHAEKRSVTLCGKVGTWSE